MNIFRTFRTTQYPLPLRNEGCENPEIDKWLVSKFVLERLVPIIGFHPFPLDELMLMTATVVCFSPSHIFEWGTHLGKSARASMRFPRRFACRPKSTRPTCPTTWNTWSTPERNGGRT